MQPADLRIVTYNIHKGFSAGNRRFILPKLRDALIEIDADIVMLQEVQGEHTGLARREPEWPHINHADFLAKDHWPHFAYAKNALYHRGHHGNAILSKHRITHWKNINVSSFSWASRSLLHGVVTLAHSQPLHIICIHFGLIQKKRTQQIQTLCQYIEQCVPQEAPLVIAGDFNDWRLQAEKHFSQHLELKECHHTLHHHYAKTFPAWLPLLKMDRMYYRHIQPTRCDNNAHQWRQLSDHTPLITDFELLRYPSSQAVNF